MTEITEYLISRYKNYLIEEEKSVATINKYIRDVTVFAKWIGKRMLDKSIVLEYKEHLMSCYAPASVNAALSSLNSFFAYNKCYNLKVKTLKIQKKLFAGKNEALTKSEYERLLKAAENNKKLYLLMQTICSCGIRVSELKFITVKSIYEKKAYINLKGKIRVIIIPNQLCRALKEYSKKAKITEGSIFVSKNGNPLDRSNIWKMMRSLCGRAGVLKSKVFPHNLRHLFARTFYRAQKDIVKLADILGHSNINTTRIYTTDTDETSRKQIERLELLLC